MDHDFTKDYQDAVQTVRKRRRKKSTSIGRKFKGAAKAWNKFGGAVMISSYARELRDIETKRLRM